MKRILFTLIAFFATVGSTVNLASAQDQAWYYAGVDSSVAFDIPTTWPIDSSGVNLSRYEIQAYIVKGYEGSLSCPDSFGNGGEYLVRWPSDWSGKNVEDSVVNSNSNIGVTHQILMCGNDTLINFSITENAMLARRLLVRLQQENPSADSWKDAEIIFHLVDSADDLPEDTRSDSGPLPLFRKSTVSSENPQELPTTISLDQNYPNPFNPQTTITYQIDSPQHVRLDVFNAQGQRIQTLVDGMRPAGQHSVRFDAFGLSSGLYVYRLQTSGETLVRKMILVR